MSDVPAISLNGVHKSFGRTQIIRGVDLEIPRGQRHALIGPNGAGSFFGPILGTIVVVLLQSGVSLLSNAWLLYVGVLFIVMVMYAPGGMMGIIALHEPVARTGRLRELVVPYARLLVPAVLAVLGFVLLVELASFTTIGAAQGKAFKIGPHTVDAHTALPWALGAVALIGSGLWLRWESRRFRARWDALIADAKAKGAML